MHGHPQPDVCVDVVVFGYDAKTGDLLVLLVERKDAPWEGLLALPGGFIRLDENLEQSVARVLSAKADLSLSRLEQLATFGETGRDSRGRVISVAYMALVAYGPVMARPRPSVRWVKADDVTERLAGLPVAFDHRQIVTVAVERLRSKIRWQPVGIDLLPPRFTLGQLERLYEAILGRGIEKRNFRRKVGKYGLLVDTGEKEPKGVGHAPGVLYRFDKGRYEALRKRGIDFEV